MDIAQVYEHYGDFVFRNLRRLGVPQEDLRDVLQDVFVTVQRALPGFEGRSAMTTWLFAICRSAARDRVRRAYRRREICNPDAYTEHPDATADVGAAVERRQELERVERLLGELDEDQRHVFALFEIEGMTGVEISEALCIPVGTVFSRLRLGRAAFREALHRDQARSLTALQHKRAI